MTLSRDHLVTAGSVTLEYADARDIAARQRPQVLVAFMWPSDTTHAVVALTGLLVRLRKLWPAAVIVGAADNAGWFVDDLTSVTATHSELVDTVCRLVSPAAVTAS